MRRRLRPSLVLALLLLSLGLLVPVGSLFVRSLVAYDVVQTDGRTYRAAGDVIEQPDEVLFTLLDEAKNEVNQVSVLREDLAEVRRVITLEHYARVFGDERTIGLLRNSALIGLGGALLALLLGVPVAWVLARVRPTAPPWLLSSVAALGERIGRLAAPLARLLRVAVPPGLLRVLAGIARGLAWLASWLRVPPRALAAALCLGPAVLPPFFIALGGARQMQQVLIDVFGIYGGTLQVVNSICVLGCVLFPLYVLLVAPALASVPAGPWESARLLRGRRSAWRHVTLPHVLPSVAGAFFLAFVLALTDFAVPDVLGFMLPTPPLADALRLQGTAWDAATTLFGAAGLSAPASALVLAESTAREGLAALAPTATPTHVFATEILFQWKQQSNTARAVASAAPFVLVVGGLLVLALSVLRRSPAFVLAGRGARSLPRARLHWLPSLLCVLFVAAVLAVSLGVPMAGIASWAGEGAESTSGGSVDPSAVDTSGVALFDFQATLDRTTGARSDRDRWLLTGLIAAILAMLVATPLARLATRGGRLARLSVIAVGSLPLAVPGLALSAGTLLLWQSVPGDWMRPLEAGPWRSALALSAKFLPFALVAAWLVLRRVRRGHEEAAAMLGAGAWARARRVIWPAAWSGVLAGGLAVFALALRELDTVILIDVQILPMRLYDKIHFNRMADEANLLILCQLYLLGPALLAALLLGWRRRRAARRGDPESP